MDNREDLIVVKTELVAMAKDLEELKDQVHDLTEALNRYKGFFGGILLTISSVGAALTLLLQYFGDKH